MLPVVVAGLATFGSTLAGGLAVGRWPGRLDLLLVFAGGVILAAALGDLLPEAIEHAKEIDVTTLLPIAMVAAGFISFTVVERAGGHDHAGDLDPGHAGIAGATGFAVHSFFDGLAIGLGFGIDASVGFVVAIAVLGHDFSDGLNTVAYLTARGQSQERSRRWLLIVASMPMLGALVGTVAPVPDVVFSMALGFFAGWFLYAATVTMLPRARNLTSAHAVPAALLGAAAMLLISHSVAH
jgi:ZIP family zinc transporter